MQIKMKCKMIIRCYNYVMFGISLQKCVTALEKTWHTEHFFCAQCGKQFGEEGFHEREGRPYCRDDYFDMFAPKCGGCSRPIMENYVSALSTQWHSSCFVCRVSYCHPWILFFTIFLNVFSNLTMKSVCICGCIFS